MRKLLFSLVLVVSFLVTLPSSGRERAPFRPEPLVPSSTRGIDSMDVEIHVDSLRIKASTDPWPVPDPEVYLKLQIGYAEYDTETETLRGLRRQILWGNTDSCEIGQDAGLVCKTFRKKIYLQTLDRPAGQIPLRVSVMDDDLQDDDLMGSTDGRGPWMMPPTVPARDTTLSINSKYVSCQLSVRFVDYCQATVGCYSYRNTPESVGPGLSYESVVTLDVNEAYPPQDSLVCVETLPRGFHLVEAIPPATVSYAVSEGDTVYTSIRWVFEGPEVHDRDIVYITNAPSDFMREIIGGWIYMPDWSWRSHFNDDVIYVGPPICPVVRSTGDRSAPPGEPVLVLFEIANLGREPDAFECRATDQASWEVIPPEFDLFLDVDEDTTVALTVIIPPGTPLGTSDEVRLEVNPLSFPAILDDDAALVWVASDFANHDVGNGTFTVTDQGILGFLDATQTQGSGFVYPAEGDNTLFIGGLWVGESPAYIASRDYDADPAREWTVSASPDGHCRIESEGYSDQDIVAAYTDSAGAEPTGLFVSQESWAFAEGDLLRDFIILECQIENRDGPARNDVYAGVFLDLDIGSYSENTGAADPSIGLVYLQDATGPYIGLSLLEQDTGSPGLANLTLVDNTTFVYPNSYILDADKYAFLAAADPEHVMIESPVPNDYGVLASAGPFDLAPGQPVTVAFALIGAPGLPELIDRARAAQMAYQSHAAEMPESNRKTVRPTGLSLVFPNPSRQASTICFDLAQAGTVSLSIYDAGGRLIRVLCRTALPAARHTWVWDGRDASGRDVPAGTYFVRLLASGREDHLPILRIR